MAIYKRGPGRYEVSVEDGFDVASGKRRRKWQSVTGTKKDAERVERELLSKRDRGISLVQSAMLLAEFLQRWLLEYAAANVAPSTLVRYRIVVVKHLTPHLGSLRLDQVQPMHIQLLHRLCREEGLAQSTVRQHHQVLSKALKSAVQWQLVQFNPADSISAPRVDRHEMAVLDEVAAREFLVFVKDHWLYPFAFLAMHTGARVGELCGLLWTDIDQPTARVSIRRTAQRLAGDGVQMGPTKSHRSQRAISVSPDCVEFLDELRAQQRSLTEEGGFTELGFVLPQPTGKPYEPGQIAKSMKRLRVDAGLPEGFRFHDFRHTHATLLLTLGVHPKVVSERLGHASVSITLDTYSHVLPSLQDQAAVAMDNILGGSDTPLGTDDSEPDEPLHEPGGTE